MEANVARRSFFRQFDALFRKSMTYRNRQARTNCCQISFPLVIIIILFILQVVVNNFVNTSDATTIPGSAHPLTLPPFLYSSNPAGLPCERAPLTMEAVEIPYSDITGDASSVVQVLGNVSRQPMAIFPPSSFGLCYVRPSAAFPMTFSKKDSKVDVDTYLYNNWAKNSSYGSYVFNDISVTGNPRLDLSVWVNSTLSGDIDASGLVNLITRPFLYIISGIDVKMLGTRDMPRQEAKVSFDLVSLIGPYIYLYIFQLILPVMLTTVVYEKEQKLREIMKMMGLNMGTYWLVTYIFNFLMYFITIMLMWILASLLNFRYYRLNDRGIIFGLIFLWGHVLVAASFFLSTLFNRSRTSVVIGYVYVFASSLLGNQVITSFLNNTSTPSNVVFGICVVPTFALYRGLLILSNSVNYGAQGLTPDDFVSSGMREVYLFMLVQWAILMLLSAYLEVVVPGGYGIKRHPLFFLQKSFWSKNTDKLKRIEVKSVEPDEPDDVARERARLVGGGQFAMEVQDLRKIYPGINGQPDKVAVHSLALAINQGECFGFLGPNGAGKSTTIGCVSGLFPPTAGTAKVYGYDIRTQIGDVHMLTGVCPQDNILWEDLTGFEHLLFYARIKGIGANKKQMTESIHELLRAVNLYNDRNKRSGRYSGGMKRRLSVAIALVGNPKLVLLDEPSTGLDPASRRQLWDIINLYKRKCAMLLTTHAMEEADALCDRLGIFDAGRLKCIGSATELKARYGKGYKVSISGDVSRGEEAHKFLLSIAPGAVLLNSLAGTRNYEIPAEEVQLGKVFQAFEANRDRLGIRDWGISNTTLEEVFIRITLGEGGSFSHNPMFASNGAEGASTDLTVIPH